MFPQRLRELRQERRLTAKELGERFSLAISTISGYETGARKPDIDLVEKFADFFDVSVDYLMGRTNIRNPNVSNSNHEEPVVQMLMRTKEELSPEAYDQLSHLIQGLAKSFKERVDKELDEKK